MLSSNTQLSLLFVSLTCLIICNGYYCWAESERHTLKFENNPNKNITHLPPVRLIQGFYSSQFAMQYAAYVYLKEQMGIDVTFYPSNDPDVLVNRYANYSGNWCGDNSHNTTSNNTLNISCSQYVPYPQFYFEDIKTNQYDLLFEIWDVMIRTGKGFDYFKREQVRNAGMSGVYGEGGWFIPKYIYDNSPEMYIPQQLKYNNTLRQIFIDAYTIHSDRDYINRWWNEWGNKLETYPSQFGVPHYSKPIIFGSYQSYAISNYSNDLVHNLLGTGINWTFVAFGTESNLTEFVIDLYNKGLPFIANLYSPHLDFASMKFERIALPRNPNNNVYDVCYSNGQCSFPLSPLLKIGNPKLLSEFTEMETFLLDFRMNTNDVNEIIAYYSNIKADMRKHEAWINATCKWLKKHKELTDEWHQNIIRYDCIFPEINSSNCGFNYYYENLQNAMDKNKIIKPWYNSIAAECMNSTIEPKCECYSDYFVGQTCRNSCPGVIGPIEHFEMTDEFFNESIEIINNFTFLLCNGHGNCDINRKTCECNAGFSGDGCEIVFEVFTYSTSLIVIFVVLFFICIILLFISILWILNYKHYATIRALSPNLTVLFTIGLLLLCLGTVLYLFHPLNDTLCVARIYFYGIGSILTIMAPLCKTYRVNIIFTQAKSLESVNISDKKLLIYLMNGVVIESIICIICNVLHEMNGGVEKIYWNEYNRIEYVCNNSLSLQYIELINYGYIFGLILILCFFSFKNRQNDKNKMFKESQCAYFGSFFTLFVFVVVVLFNIVVSDINIVVTIQSGAMLITIGVIWGLFYGQRMYKFYIYPSQRNEVRISVDIGISHTIRPTNANNNEIKNQQINLSNVYIPKYVKQRNKQKNSMSVPSQSISSQSIEKCKMETDTKITELPNIVEHKSYEHLDESDSLE